MILPWHKNKESQQAETALINNLTTLNVYFRTWKLNPNLRESKDSFFNLNNMLANLKLQIVVDRIALKHSDEVKGLDVTTDRPLAYKIIQLRTNLKLYITLPGLQGEPAYSPAHYSYVPGPLGG